MTSKTKERVTVRLCLSREAAVSVWRKDVPRFKTSPGFLGMRGSQPRKSRDITYRGTKNRHLTSNHAKPFFDRIGKSVGGWVRNEGERGEKMKWRGGIHFMFQANRSKIYNLYQSACCSDRYYGRRPENRYGQCFFNILSYLSVADEFEVVKE